MVLIGANGVIPKIIQLLHSPQSGDIQTAFDMIKKLNVRSLNDLDQQLFGFNDTIYNAKLLIQEKLTELDNDN